MKTEQIDLNATDIIGTVTIVITAVAMANAANSKNPSKNFSVVDVKAAAKPSTITAKARTTAAFKGHDIIQDRLASSDLQRQTMRTIEISDMIVGA